MTRRLHHLLRVPGYLLGLLLVLELLLQLGALVVKDQARLVQAQWLTGNTRVLALGDSNTYGLYLQAQDAWPAQLQRQWNAAHPERPVEVLNLGYPATNSFRVRDTLPGLLDKLSPDIVLIMVGFNDFWTPREAVAGGQQPLLERIKAGSRLYRLYSIWSRSHISEQDMAFGYPRGGFVDVNSAEQRQVRVDGDVFALGAQPGEPARNRSALQDNMKAMIGMVRARGMKVYLLTYPSNWGFYPGANKWLKVIAEAESVPLVDITPLFVERCKDGPASCPDLLFHDGHATAQGNVLVAAKVNSQLEQLR